jgi:hypothetical protein
MTDWTSFVQVFPFAFAAACVVLLLVMWIVGRWPEPWAPPRRVRQVMSALHEWVVWHKRLPIHNPPGPADYLIDWPTQVPLAGIILRFYDAPQDGNLMAAAITDENGCWTIGGNLPDTLWFEAEGTKLGVVMHDPGY